MVYGVRKHDNNQGPVTYVIGESANVINQELMMYVLRVRNTCYQSGAYVILFFEHLASVRD